MNSSLWIAPSSSSSSSSCSHNKRSIKRPRSSEDDHDDESFLQEPFKRLRVEEGHQHQFLVRQLDMATRNQNQPWSSSSMYPSSLQAAAAAAPLVYPQQEQQNRLTALSHPEHETPYLHDCSFWEAARHQQPSYQQEQPSLLGQQQQQNPGQDSSKSRTSLMLPQPDYASMNHLLGSLHHERRIRRQQEEQKQQEYPKESQQRQQVMQEQPHSWYHQSNQQQADGSVACHTTQSLSWSGMATNHKRKVVNLFSDSQLG